MQDSCDEVTRCRSLSGLLAAIDILSLVVADNRKVDRLIDVCERFGFDQMLSAINECMMSVLV